MLKQFKFIQPVCLIVLVLIITSCQKDDWVDVEINTSGCKTGPSLGSANEAEGIIHVADFQDLYCIETNDILDSGSENLLPCNISLTESQEGQKIIFNGEFFEITGTDYVNGVYLGYPIKISKAKILKK